MGWIGTIVFGIVIGALARLVLPGKQQLPIWMHIIIGVVGALIGGALWNALGSGGDTDGIDWMMWILSIAAAAVLILIVEQVRGRE